MASIGEGYVWPNITIFSDGERIAVISKPTRDRPNTRFRYLSDDAVVLPADAFEYAVTQFIQQTRDLLKQSQIANSNLDLIWNDIQEEKSDPEIAKRRKLEALLGCDPNEAAEATVESILEDARELGEYAMNEVAADHAATGRIVTGEILRSAAADSGFDASPMDSVRLALGTDLPRKGEVAAWRFGAQAAKAVRQQIGIGPNPISNECLAKTAGVPLQALVEKRRGLGMSFALDSAEGKSRVVLRSNWETGRRFELARLLCDRLLATGGGSLFPATQAYTYRQKVQRAFAAELLSPFEVVDDMLSGDYSMESQQDIAEHFNVSDVTVRILLVNHRRIEREELDEDLDVVALD